MSKLGLSMLGMGPAPIAGLLPSGATSTRAPHPLMPNTGNSQSQGGASGLEHTGTRGRRATGKIDPGSVSSHLSAATTAHASGNHKGFTGSVFKALSAARKAARKAKLPQRTTGQLGTGNPGHSLPPGGGSVLSGGSPAANPVPGSGAGGAVGGG